MKGKSGLSELSKQRFHSVGALMAKAWTPHHDLGVTSRSPSSQLNGQAGTHQVNKSEAYLEAKTFKTFKSKQHWRSAGNLTRSGWMEANKIEMLLSPFDPVMSQDVG